MFILGSKGVPAKYGGFETFVENLTLNKINNNIQYYVSCISDKNNFFLYNDSHCFNIKTPNIGAGKVIYYDLKSLDYAVEFIKNNNLDNVIFYLLGCRIGFWSHRLLKKVKSVNGTLLLNPDGLEWKRDKWILPIKKYLKYSEGKLVNAADIVVCDSNGIKTYIENEYGNHICSEFIAYGADRVKSTMKDSEFESNDFIRKNNIRKKEYYLSVGRFVPENNFEIMLKGFNKSSTDKDFVLITDVKDNNYYRKIIKDKHIISDPRIKFVGTLYDQELLKKIREQSFAYIHGHSVGGTNPSLLESLAMTDLNLLYDVSFNKEVAEDSGLYFSSPDELAFHIDKMDKYDKKTISTFSEKARSRISEIYNWPRIVELYEGLFFKIVGKK